MRKIKPVFNSLLFKLFLAVFAVIGPLLIVLVVNQYYSVSVIRNQVAQSNKNMLNIYMGEIDRNLEIVEKYLYQLSQDNSDLAYYQSREQHDFNEFLQAKLRLNNTLQSNADFYGAIDSVFVYTSAYDDFLNTQTFGSDLLERDSAKDEILQFIRTKPEPLQYGHWRILEGKDRNYLLYYIKNENIYVGAWVDIDKLIIPFKHLDFGDTGRALIANSSFAPLTSIWFVEREGIDISFKENMYAVSGDSKPFIVMKEHSNKGDFYLVALIPESKILEQLPFLQKISSVFLVIAILFLLFFIFIMRRIFLQPITQLVIAMKKLRKGNLDIRLPEQHNSTEFAVMNETFNHMISEIKDLKINIYEEKLNHQRAELKHLQLQINPHFFLNSLNIIYNLATVKNYAVIQEMAKCLANYFRFMFKSNSYFVSLKDEIMHTDNYLKIQQLRFPDTFVYTIQTPTELSECKIPPLMIQTLVENSIKHAFTMDESIEISVLVEQENKDFIKIKVQDTGEGFAEDILEILERDGSLTTEEGERIGIWNIKRRLSLLYKEKTDIHFLNEPGKGATVMMRLPLQNISIEGDQ
ncbi:sensor histidine kinase [Metabacillus halosaccharovorans]|uniref:sensor histidine kinase n=1 Tax=Metabacillus halosaccharovorans TaxID=930124 RepID=UPI001C1FAA9A|nr:histidine kinase [Metabacillus halosaccharovorans]MBU7591210.1 HAMP domain-containing protein [Metabacillus halosaccharovorans]